MYNDCKIKIKIYGDDPEIEQKLLKQVRLSKLFNINQIYDVSTSIDKDKDKFVATIKLSTSGYFHLLYDTITSPTNKGVKLLDEVIGLGSKPSPKIKLFHRLRYLLTGNISPNITSLSYMTYVFGLKLSMVIEANSIYETRYYYCGYSYDTGFIHFNIPVDVFNNF